MINDSATKPLTSPFPDLWRVLDVLEAEDRLLSKRSSEQNLSSIITMTVSLCSGITGLLVWGESLAIGPFVLCLSLLINVALFGWSLYARKRYNDQKKYYLAMYVPASKAWRSVLERFGEQGEVPVLPQYELYLRTNRLEMSLFHDLQPFREIKYRGQPVN